MKIERFKENSKKRKSIYVIGGVVILLLTAVFVFQSFAFYEEKQEFDVIKGRVPEYMSDYDVNIALTIDGVVSTTFPEKGSNKAVSSIECDKDASAYWDYEKWMISVDAKNTRTKCKINFVTKYVDTILNGADPVLSDGLVPIKNDENGVVRKANLGESWYNYGNKEWANAVILVDKNEVYENNEVIPEDKIESYFVWIPRYRYKIFNNGNYSGFTTVEMREKTIEVVFETKDQNISNGNAVGDWLTHPAFTAFDTNGMWVGKFETGYKEAQSDGNISKIIQIKPNVYSWRKIRVADAFTVSYNYRRSMDSHMMKNTEWGAVAYLSHSAYGIQKSIRINNNSAYITGYAAKDEPTCGYAEVNEECSKYEKTALGVDGTYTLNYNNNASVVASTTGNRTGVYDMSGGTEVYVMGVILDQNNNLVSGRNDQSNSNFIGTLTYPNDGNNTSKISWTVADGGISYPEAKYYDTYKYSTSSQEYNRRKLGDATGEMGPFANVTNSYIYNQVGSWYGDGALFFTDGDPWLVRGGNYNYGLVAGIFSFFYHHGSAQSYIGFRVVLSI